MAMASSSIENNIVDDDDEEACLTAMIFANSLIFPVVLHTAIELDLFNIIAKSDARAYLLASEIASHLPSTNPDAPSMLDKMLQLFTAHSLISYAPQISSEDGKIERTYALTPASKFFTGNVMNVSFTPRLGFHKASLDCFLNMKNAILDGENAFTKAHGVSMYEYMDKDHEFMTIFNKTMVGHSTLTMNGILAKYEGFEGVETLVDVGGGIGRVLNMVISKYPSIKGINFDLPLVVQSAPSYPGIKHVGGDMFRSVPTEQTIMIKNICHNWSDEKAIKILKNIYKALPKNGKLIIIEALLPEHPDTSKASQYIAILHNIMLSQLPSGKERSSKEIETLAKASGFTTFKVVCVAYGISCVMECYK
ncbi:O-methyltransferase family protein [Euphorbia peplus]|nr:O-methyltransferase family protein [Euphorbia peplus]